LPYPKRYKEPQVYVSPLGNSSSTAHLGPLYNVLTTFWVLNNQVPVKIMTSRPPARWVYFSFLKAVSVWPLFVAKGGP